MIDEPQFPQLPCCQCGEIMHVYLQPGLADFPAAYYVTCVNTKCVMWGHTLSAAHYPPANLELYLKPTWQEDVVELYINLVRQESALAAAAIDQIRASAGAAAALRAALIVTVFRMEVKQNHCLPDTSVYTYLIDDYPEVVLLVEYALGCCLQNWGILTLELPQLKEEFSHQF